MIYKEQLCTASYEEINMSHRCEVEFIIIIFFWTMMAERNEPKNFKMKDRCYS